jgi:sugar lactone lactonase YvrE
VALLLVLAACGSRENATPPPVDPPADPPADPREPIPTPAVLTIDGFSTPESVLYDVEGDRYLVSNIDGTPFAKDDNGFISDVAPDGTVRNLRFIDGASEDVTLNAPKGMAIAGGKLWVADIDVVRVFDRATGTPAGEVAVPGATFLNDVAAGADGAIYVSDSGLQQGDTGFAPSGTDAIHRVTLGEPPVAVVRSAELGRPNGLAVIGGTVWAVTFGTGEMYRIVAGEKTDSRTLPAGSLDGIVALPDGRVLVSSWEGSAIYSGRPGDAFTPVVEGITSPADIGYDTRRQRVLVPSFTGNEVKVYELP